MKQPQLTKRKGRWYIKRMQNVVKRSKGSATMPKDGWTAGTRSDLLCKDNRAEVHMRHLLKECNALHHRERPIEINGKKYFIDFLVSGFRDPYHRIRVAIEVDGGYHFTEEQKVKDRQKDSDLLKASRIWSVLRIRDSVCMTMTASQLGAVLRGMKMGEVRRLYAKTELPI